MNRKGSAIRSRGSSRDRQQFQVEPERRKKSTLSINRLSKVSLGGAPTMATPLKGLNTPSKGQHMNLAPPGGINRLSCRGSGFGMPAKKTPWEISDPAFKSRCINKVLDFLLSNNFESVTRNTLKSPTAKDFANIFTFIYQFLDPHFKLTKMEEQIPKLMKRYNYPAQLTKSTFLNVGSPHAWPSVLAMLAWLCDIVPCADSENLIQNMFQKEFESEKSSVEQKLNVVISCFNVPEEEYSDLLQEYRVELENIKGVSDEDFQKVLDIQEDCAMKLEQVPCLEEEVGRIKETYQGLQIDCEKLVEYKEKMAILLSEKDEDRIALNKQRDEMQNSVDQIKEEIANLEDLKQNQDISIDEVQKIKTFGQKYISVMEYYRQEENDLKQKQWKVETELSKLRLNSWSTSVCEFASKSRHIGVDSSFLSNGDVDNFNNNKGDVVVVMRNSLANLVGEVALANDTLAETVKTMDQISDQLNNEKKKLVKMEKTRERFSEEKNILKKEINIQNERLQAEVDQLAEDILKMKRGPEVNSSRRDRLQTLTNEYKSLIEENIKKQEEATVRVVKKKQNVEWFLAKKGELLTEHNKTMRAMNQKFVGESN